VERISTMDGVKFFLEDDQWALMRFSGTEPVLRLFAEAESEERARALVEHLKTKFDLTSTAPE
jgi:phosphomannomutase